MFDGADMFSGFLGGLFGGALVWHFKDSFFIPFGRLLISVWKGAGYFSSAAQADIAKFEAKIASLKAAFGIK